jgi:hypothetical protein
MRKNYWSIFFFIFVFLFIFSLIYGIHFLLILFECGSEYHMDSIPTKVYHDIFIQIIAFDLLLSVIIFIPLVLIFRVLIQ